MLTRSAILHIASGISVDERRMRCILGKVTSEDTVDAFIEQAKEIVDKFKSSPVLAVKAQEEGRALLRRFEEYLEAMNLKAIVTQKHRI